jgi:hypothetical protein
VSGSAQTSKLVCADPLTLRYSLVKKRCKFAVVSRCASRVKGVCLVSSIIRSGDALRVSRRLKVRLKAQVVLPSAEAQAMLRSMQNQTSEVASVVGRIPALEGACINLWLKQTRAAPRFAKEVQRRVLHFFGSAGVGCALFNSGRYALCA